MSESAVQAVVRLELAKRGYKLWRNNVGVMKDDRGVPVRYGLANDSRQLNERLKSSDLVGWCPTLVTPDMVGSVIARMVSLECKPEGWRPALSGKLFEHEEAQRRWINMIVADGGEARFVTGI